VSQNGTRTFTPIVAVLIYGMNVGICGSLGYSKAWFEGHHVARWALLVGVGIDAAHTSNNAALFEGVEMPVQGGATDLAIMGQPLLGRETPVIRIEAVAEMPEHDLGRGLKASLLDGPVGGSMAHGANLRAGLRTRLVKP